MNRCFLSPPAFSLFSVLVPSVRDVWCCFRKSGAGVLGIFVLSGLLTGCMTVGPDFEAPTPDMPETWLPTEGTPSEVFTAAKPLELWWRVFNDPALDSLIRRARVQSPSVELALLRIEQAQAQYAIAIGKIFPQQQELTSSYTATRPSDRSPGAPQPGEPDAPKNILELNVGLQVSWELDFWGKYRRASESARAQLLAMHAGYDLALVTLTAEVAQQYFTFRTLEEQLRIANDNNRAQLETVRLTEVRYRLGATSERDYMQAVAQQKGTEADIPQFRRQIAAAHTALSVLLGENPGTVPELSATASLAIPSSIATGIPADLLRRRPDVRQAEYTAAAQCARIGVRKADLFPSLSLGGFIGFQGSNVGAFSLGDTLGHGFTANGGPSLLLPLFNYGRLLNAVRVEDALFRQALTQYRQTVLTALQEAENAQTGLVRNQERLRLLTEARDAARRSVKLVTDQYTAGSTDFTSVVSAQSTLYTQENAVVSTAGATVQQAVALFRALGGGWQSGESGEREENGESGENGEKEDASGGQGIALHPQGATP